MSSNLGHHMYVERITKFTTTASIILKGGLINSACPFVERQLLGDVCPGARSVGPLDDLLLRALLFLNLDILETNNVTNLRFDHYSCMMPPAEGGRCRRQPGGASPRGTRGLCHAAPGWQEIKHRRLGDKYAIEFAI